MRNSLAALLILLPLGAHAAELAIGYLEIENDPRHAEQRGYAGIVVAAATEPRQGADMALAESAPLFQATGTGARLEPIAAADVDGLEAAVAAREEQGVRFFIADLPDQVFLNLSLRLKDHPVWLLNATATADVLRREACQANVLHVAPSRAMLTDALAQFLASRNWRRVLLVRGPADDDGRAIEAFRRSAKRFGLTVADERPMVPGSDPRQRQANDPVQVTAGESYDAIYVADQSSDLAHSLLYRTALPRPVVGAVGLHAVAWHWAWERDGGPQLSSRFLRRAGRPMTGADWGAWAAARLIAQAVARTRSVEPGEVAAALLQTGDFDTYKGAPGSFRPWNHQLRQPVLLASGEAVVDRAPLPGFPHDRLLLDTLGDDEAESTCAALKKP